MYTLLLASLFTYINWPVADMREEPSSTSKMASQAIYSEKVDILDTNTDWAKIQTPDNYQGWVKKDSLFQSEQPFPTSNFAKVSRMAAHVYHVQDTEYGPIKTLPFESKVEIVDNLGNPDGRWLQIKLVDGTLGYIQRGDITFNNKPLTREEMVEFSKFFMNLPYTWGGRSSFGYDCSGFVQMLYRQMGIAIPRDSKDQAVWSGFKEVSFDALQPGDLIFFGAAKPKITHVGMYIGNGQFIHTAFPEHKPYLRISNLSDAYWNGTGNLTHRLARTLK